MFWYSRMLSNESDGEGCRRVLDGRAPGRGGGAEGAGPQRVLRSAGAAAAHALPDHLFMSRKVGHARAAASGVSRVTCATLPTLVRRRLER